MQKKALTPPQRILCLQNGRLLIQVTPPHSPFSRMRPTLLELDLEKVC